jgi:hypothetical protein
LKSAAFGTPAPPPDETILDDESPGQQEEPLPRKSTMSLQSGSISPIKPQGILLTPGTATSRRKTVSFGHEVLDKAEKNAIGKATTKDASGKCSSGEAKSEQPSKPTRLTRALENAREGKAGPAGSEKTRGSFESQPLLNVNQSADDKDERKSRLGQRASKTSKSNQDLMQELMTGRQCDGDMTNMTIDLNEPHSQSGIYWKSEFERYHDEAQNEMKNLTRYKNLAKSYAKKKDAEALYLAEKLMEEQKRVVSMEEKLSKLTAEIATGGLEGEEDNSPVLIKELARQTALAVQYRAQVEEFRKALEGNDGRVDRRNDGKRSASPVKEQRQTLLDKKQELKTREQLKEMDAVRDELRDLKKRLSAAEVSTKKLQEENTKLTQELLHADLRLEKEIEKSEKRRLGFQERLQKKDEALQSLQKDYDSLKEAAKSQRRDAEHLLKKRHDQVVELKKELASKKSIESTAKDLQQALQEKTAEHNKIISDYQRQIERLINTQSQDVQNMPMITLPTNAALAQAESTGITVTNNEHPNPRDSQIPVVSQSITRPLKALAATKNSRSDKPAGALRPQSSHPALSDITNGASSDRHPPQTSSSVQYTPMADRFANLSLQSPKMDLPSPESFVPSQPPGRAIHEKNGQPSPRPSMFVIPSSPPKRAMMRSRTSGELARQRSINAFANASSRLSSLEGSRTRNTLPPERAAAAKARLEQKNAEKKRAQAMGTNKENIRA